MTSALRAQQVRFQRRGQHRSRVAPRALLSVRIHSLGPRTAQPPPLEQRLKSIDQESKYVPQILTARGRRTLAQAAGSATALRGPRAVYRAGLASTTIRLTFPQQIIVCLVLLASLPRMAERRSLIAYLAPLRAHTRSPDRRIARLLRQARSRRAIEQASNCVQSSFIA